jgi:hypothetical protein
VDISLFGLWFVCGLGTAVFAALTPVSRSGAVLSAVAFVVGAGWMRLPFAPATAAVGVTVFVAAAAYLVRPPRPILGHALAGLLAGLWTGVLERQGLPLAAAIPIAMAVPALSAMLRARRVEFAPAPLRDEALLFTVVLGLFAAAAPAIVDGWHSAVTLNLQASQPDAARTAIPAWAVSLSAAALAAGGLFSIWSRR